MYLGRIVETAPAAELFANPRHPYTRALLSAIPVPQPARAAERVILEGDVPSALSPPAGCHLHHPLPPRLERCRSERPAHRRGTACYRLPSLGRIACRDCAGRGRRHAPAA